ncbi:MAG TPA: hypothetical protein VF789_06815 [Thermoanaerobaculia bacterium]
MVSVEGSQENAFASEAVELLRLLFETDETFVVTNQSMRVFLGKIQRQLVYCLEAKKEADLLEWWREALPGFRDHMLVIASESRVSLPNGTLAPILTEDRASRLIGPCPDAPDF